MEFSLKQIQEQYEGQHFDRKSARLNPKDLAKHVIALANAEGGVLVVGVEDDGKISGTNYEGAYSLIEYKTAVGQELAHEVEITYSELSCYNENNEIDQIYVIEVSVMKGQLVEAKSGSVYLRISHESLKQSDEQITKLKKDIPKRSYEDKVIKGSSIDDIDNFELNRFKETIDLGHVENDEFLDYFKFMVEGELTLAGLLLFSNNTDKFLKNNKLVFKHFEEDKLIFQTSLNATIPKMLEEIHSIIRPLIGQTRRVNEKGYIELVPDFPEFAWSEGIVNALLHRDYRKDDYVRVNFYDNYIEIYSPGQLLDYIELDSIGKTRYSRNPRLARALSIFGWGKRNEGIDKIHAVMEKFKLNQPHYEIIEDRGLLLRLENNKK